MKTVTLLFKDNKSLIIPKNHVFYTEVLQKLNLEEELDINYDYMLYIFFDIPIPKDIIFKVIHFIMPFSISEIERKLSDKLYNLLYENCGSRKNIVNKKFLKNIDVLNFICKLDENISFEEFVKELEKNE